MLRMVNFYFVFSENIIFFEYVELLNNWFQRNNFINFESYNELQKKDVHAQCCILHINLYKISKKIIFKWVNYNIISLDVIFFSRNNLKYDI